MIDTTDKYEGHTEGEWILLGDDEQGYGVKTPKHDDPMAFIERRNDDGEIVSLSKADAVLIADAPLLLAEVQRLRERLSFVNRHPLPDAPLLLTEVKRLRKELDLLWDAIRLSGTGGNQKEEIAFWHEKLLNMNEAELKEAFKEHYEELIE